MRTLLLSDIHANAEALGAVLQDANLRGFDRACFLGDAVGYGPDPAFALERLAELDALCVLGNHDAWLLGLAAGDNVGGGVVGESLRWQLGRLSPEHLERLRGWPERLEVSCEGLDDAPQDFLAVHGSPQDAWEYVDSPAVARSVFAAWGGRLACVGHTHRPGVYEALEGPLSQWVRQRELREGEPLALPPRARWIANPGSVGQPRDGDPRAAYALYDEARGVLELFRVPYDCARTGAKIRAAGLPESLSARLAVGR